MEAILPCIVSLLKGTVRVSTCTAMEMEFLFRQKLANLTHKDNSKLRQAQKWRERMVQGNFFPFNLLMTPYDRNVILVKSKIWLNLGEFIDVNNERI